MKQQNAKQFSYEDFCKKLWINYRGTQRLLTFGPVRMGQKAEIEVNVSHIFVGSGLHHSVAPEYETVRQMAHAYYLRPNEGEQR